MCVAAKNALGIYISIPFCRSKCTYCNFASGVFPASQHRRYVERVIEELSGAKDWTERLGVELPRRVDTVYLGGGTPSLLEPKLVAALFAAMRAEFDLDADAEITMECAPGQIADATLAAMAAAGVNRVSLGVQSFVDREAQVSGRLHTRAMVEEDLRRLRRAGITNLNLDLIAGLAGQTPASWEQSLDVLLAAGAPHASVYMLEVDEDSRLGREMLAGGARYYAELVPSDDAIAEMYGRAIERLDEAGLRQYEISNFSAAGFESRHNLRYWERRPYLGVGLDASSMLRGALHGAGNQSAGEMRTSGAKAPVHPASATARLKSCPDTSCWPDTASSPDTSCLTGKSPLKSEWSEPVCVLRAKTTDDLTEYLDGPRIAETAWLAPVQQFEEAWFLGLRLNAGVDVRALKDEFGVEAVAAALETVGRLVGDGLLSSDGSIVRLTARGRMVSNDVFQEFLGLGASQVSKFASAGADGR
ncbi:MAG: radical SAM family heme chaperone HemW [Terracidiphilus sp.]